MTRQCRWKEQTKKTYCRLGEGAWGLIFSSQENQWHLSDYHQSLSKASPIYQIAQVQEVYTQDYNNEVV